jgi:predicted transposase YbfD/YdcC
MTGVLIAILHGRKTPSSIQRFIKNRLKDLEKWTNHSAESAVSDTQLRRIVRGVDWVKYNEVNEKYFGVNVEQLSDNEWVAIDGKELRGSLAKDVITGNKAKRGEVVINAVSHRSKAVISQTYYRGDKESEKVYVRHLLEKSGLKKSSVTLDALHCNPKTTSLVEGANGKYLIQVKEDQKALMEELQLSVKFRPCLFEQRTLDKGHGRIEARRSRVFSIEGGDFDDRWDKSGIRSLVVTDRHFTEIKTGKESAETSYHISNQGVVEREEGKMKSLAGAVRGHWSVEADNYVRDVTFGEDQIKTQKGNSTRIWAAMRTVGINIVRKIRPTNIQAKIESWVDCPKIFFSDLKNVGFF